jgi:hypothetical protein
MFQGVFTQRRCGEQTLPLAQHQLHNSLCWEFVQVKVNFTVCLRSGLIPPRLNRVIISKQYTEESTGRWGALWLEYSKPNISVYEHHNTWAIRRESRLNVSCVARNMGLNKSRRTAVSLNKLEMIFKKYRTVYSTQKACFKNCNFKIFTATYSGHKL